MKDMIALESELVNRNIRIASLEDELLQKKVTDKSCKGSLSRQYNVEYSIFFQSEISQSDVTHYEELNILMQERDEVSERLSRTEKAVADLTEERDNLRSALDQLGSRTRDDATPSRNKERDICATSSGVRTTFTQCTNIYRDYFNAQSASQLTNWHNLISLLPDKSCAENLSSSSDFEELHHPHSQVVRTVKSR